MGIIKEINIKNQKHIASLMTWLVLKNLTQTYYKETKIVIQKHWDLLNWIYHNERFWLWKYS